MSQPDEQPRTTTQPAGAPTGEAVPTAGYPSADYSGPPSQQGQLPPEVQSGGHGAFPVQPGYAVPGYAAPGYPAPGYPQPGYASPGYPAPGYGPGYPPGAAPYGFQPYGYGPRGPVRPGGATAAVVLMFIQAGVVLISTFYVLFFASLAGTASSAGVSEADSYEVEFTVIGILQLVSVGLLIFAGVQLLGGTSRTLTIVSCAVQLAFVIYWMIRIGSLPDFGDEGTTFFVVPLMYAVLPIVALPLALGRPVTDYIAAKSGGQRPGMTAG